MRKQTTLTPLIPDPIDSARPDDPATPNIDEGAQADSRIRALADSLYSIGVR